MTVWFTSDLHIGHILVARHRLESRIPILAGYPVDEDIAITHDMLLAMNWDSVVKPDDQIWVLGDISAGGTKAQLAALEWLKPRPGRKHLIAGNHDGVHPMHRSAHKMLSKYHEAFDSVQQSAVRNVPMADGSVQRALLSHFPYQGEGGRLDGDRFTQWRLPDYGMPILHGHVHSSEQLTLTTRGYDPSGGWETQQVHVGLDAWDLKPVSLEQISEVLDR